MGELGPLPTVSGAEFRPGRLPCLSSNNSIGAGSFDASPVAVALSTQQRKSACALAWNVQAMAQRWGLERLGFLTLTFADHVLSPREAQRRFNSLASHVLRVRYEAFVRVIERQKSGRLHYHLLVVLPFDARSGVSFDGFGDGDYRSASPELRAEWAFWRATAKRFRFGRTELMPIRSTEEAIGRYVGKYIGKHHAHRRPEDRGVRLVEYSRGARQATTKFAWATDGARSWRSKVRVFSLIVAARHGREAISFSELSLLLGPRWAHRHRDFIAALPEV